MQANVTVFAPTDAAFAEIDNGAGLTVAQISEVLTYHAALGRVFSSSLNAGTNNWNAKPTKFNCSKHFW